MLFPFFMFISHFPPLYPQIIKMMLTVVGIYGICWLPLHAITLAADVDYRVWEIPYMRFIWISAHWLAMSSCAYNPFIYWWMNPKFHEGYQSLFASIRESICDRCHPHPDCERRRSTLSSIGSRRYGNGNSKRPSATQIIDLASFSTCDIRRDSRGDKDKVKCQPLGKISEANESNHAKTPDSNNLPTVVPVMSGYS